MALSPHERHWRLHVTDVDVNLADQGFADSIKIVFHGKLLPSTKTRLLNALAAGAVSIEEKTLT